MKIIVDPEKCTGCKSCELICSLSRSEAFNPRRARIRVVDLDYLGFSNPVLCLRCQNPRCVQVCPQRALGQTDQQTIVVDEAKCDGCRSCVEECIVGAIRFDDRKNLPLICDLCGGHPLCVPWCSSGALRFANRQGRVSRKAWGYTIAQSLPFLKKWGISERALDWYKQFL